MRIQRLAFLRPALVYAGWTLVGWVVFAWRLGYPSFWDPDEAKYAQTAREMLAAHPIGDPHSDTGAYERTAGKDVPVETRDSAPRPEAAPGSPASDAERMIARDRREDGAGAPAKPREPRIEQYRER